MNRVGNWFLGFEGDGNGCVFFLFSFCFVLSGDLGRGAVRGTEERGSLKEFEHLMEKQG